MKRIVYLDLLRVMAIFGVIVIHVFCTDYPASFISSDWYVALVGDSMVRWAVPVLVMISGALFLRPEKEITIPTLLKKHIPHLLIAYIFWTLAYGIVVTWFKTSYKGEPFTIGYLLTPHFHLWFLPMLMGVYLLVPLLRKIAKDDKLLRYALLIWLVYITLSFVKPDIIGIRQITNLFNVNIVIGYAGYALCGYYLSQKTFSKRQRWLLYILGIIGLAVTISGNLVFSLAKGESNEFFWNCLSPQVIAMASALFILVKEISPKAGKSVLWFVDYVRKDLFGIYLTHALWLLLLDRDPIRNCCNQAITLPMITIAVFILSLYTTKLIRLIPGVKKVVE